MGPGAGGRWGEVLGRVGFCLYLGFSRVGSSEVQRCSVVRDGLRVPRQGDLGPFNPGLPVQVPLWLAINLKQRQKCRLLAPEWMDVGKDVGDEECCGTWDHPPARGPSFSAASTPQLKSMNGPGLTC